MDRAIDSSPLVKGLLCASLVALGLIGPVRAQTGISTGQTYFPTSPGQQAVANLFNSRPASDCTASTSLDIAQATAPGATLQACAPGGPGYGGIALQQLSNQSSIQTGTTVLASPAETARVVRCLSARRNGLDAPGCEDVIGAAGSGIYPGVALTSFPAATRADLAAAGFSASPATAIAGPFGLSVVIRGNKGTQDTVSGQTGFDATAGMLNLGLDYRFSERSVGGISFSYQHTKLDLDLNSGTLSNDAYRLAPFFSYAVTPTVLVDGLIGIGILDYSSERICSACVVPATDAPQTLVNTASYLGTQWFGSIGIGNLWPLGAWTLHGYARGDFMQLKTDGYTEAGTLISGTSTSAALQVQSQRATSLTSLLGIRASRAISTKAGVLTPAARVEWVHQFADDSRTLYSQFVSVPVPTLMAVTTADPVRDWANVGLSLQMNFARSLVGFVDYMYMYRRDANNHALSLGIRFSF